MSGGQWNDAKNSTTSQSDPVPLCGDTGNACLLIIWRKIFEEHINIISIFQMNAQAWRG